MRWVYAVHVVAGMADIHAFWDRPNKRFVTSSVRIMFSFKTFDLTVASNRCGSHPHPASSLGYLFYLLFYAFSCNWYRPAHEVLLEIKDLFLCP